MNFKGFVTTEFGEGNYKSKRTRTIYKFAAPLKVGKTEFKDKFDEPSEQMEIVADFLDKIKDKMEDEKIGDTTIFALALLNKVFNDLIA